MLVLYQGLAVVVGFGFSCVGGSPVVKKEYRSHSVWQEGLHGLWRWTGNCNTVNATITEADCQLSGIASLITKERGE